MNAPIRTLIAETVSDHKAQLSSDELHAQWDAEDDALPTLEQRAARLKAALESPRHQALQKQIDERAEREAVRLQARADAEFAQLSRQFCKAFGIEEPKVLRGRL